MDECDAIVVVLLEILGRVLKAWSKAYVLMWGV
jgi:hypothetical protein